MNLRQLRYLIAVADELSFTLAAARCNVSQPPLSRAIKDLEEEVGACLVERSTHHVALTPAGERLVRDVRRALVLIDTGADQARRIAAGLKGTIKIGFGGSTVYSLVPEMIRRVRAQLPDVSIQFEAMPVLHQIDALRDGTIDLGVLRLPVHDELIETRLAYSEPLIVALPDMHPLATEDGPLEVSALASSAFITYQPRRGFNYHIDLLTLCRLAGFMPVIAHEAASTEAVIGIVACGEGVALVPASAERFAMKGVLFKHLRSEASPLSATVEFGLAWHRERASPLTEAFIDLAVPNKDARNGSTDRSRLT